MAGQARFVMEIIDGTIVIGNTVNRLPRRSRRRKKRVNYCDVSVNDD